MLQLRDTVSQIGPARPWPQRAAEFGASFAALVALSIGGTAVSQALHLPVPGPLVGGAVLAAWLTKYTTHAQTLPAADVLVRLLPLFFVPLVAGAAEPLRALGTTVVPLAVTTISATLAAIVATVAVASLGQWLSSRSS